MSNNKILHICTVGITARAFLLPIFKKLQAEGYDITFACSDDADARFVAQHGIPFFPVKINRKIHPSDLLAIIKLYNFIKNNNFALVNTHTAKAGFVGRTAAWLAKTNCIVHTAHGLVVHDFLPKYKKIIYKFLEKWIGKKTDYFIVVTKKVGDELLKSGISTKNKLIKIYNGLDLKKFNNIDVNKIENLKIKFNIQHEKIIIGAISRLVPDKGLDDLIRAFAMITKNQPNTLLIIAGDGELKNNLINLTEKLNIKQNVRFIGWQNDVPAVLKMFDVFCLPTLREGFGYVFLEAQAAGVPVVATKIEPLTETMSNGNNAILVPTHSPESIASAIQKIIKNNELRQQLIDNGKKNVYENFDRQKQLNEIVNFYKKIL